VVKGRISQKRFEKKQVTRQDYEETQVGRDRRGDVSSGGKRKREKGIKG